MLDSNKKLFRWGPLDAALLPLSYTAFQMYEPMKELFGICWPESLIIFDRDKALWLLNNDEVEKAGQDFLEKIILPNKERERFYALWNERVDNLNKVQEKVKSHSLKKINDEKLGHLIKEWNDKYLGFWTIGMMAELANYPLETRLKNQLKPYFEDERDLNEAFALLATPNEMSFYKEEESELMEISLLDGQKKDEALSRHQNNYFWIYNNYLESKILPVSYFKEQIKHTSQKDAKEFLVEIKNYKKRVIEGKESCIRKLNLSEDEIKAVNLLNDFIIFQDVRKKYNLIAAHYLEEFLKEISKRTNIQVRDLKWLLPRELEDPRREDKKEIIEKRKHLTVMSIKLGSVEFFTQNKASKLQKEFDKAEFEKTVNLQGTVACTGKHRYFRGIAKIIHSPKDADKLKDGEILVTGMTTPDFVTCMKRAGAIITNVGGVTCHAAVVSREFGIPCIVGTENATKIIKDGNILELHNLRGTINIISE